MIPAVFYYNILHIAAFMFYVLCFMFSISLLFYFSSKIFSMLAIFTQTTKISAAVVRSSKLG